MSEQKFSIRFGLGAIKAVGLGMMEAAVAERKANGKFKDIYDFSSRLDPKSVNKKSIEALAKSGSLECLAKNRRQIFESFEILSSYAAEKKEAALSNQMSFFGDLISEEDSNPKLKDVADWTKEERLQKEFEAFGFFLNEHPLDDYVLELKKRGAVFSDKIERDEFEDNDMVKMAGVVASSKHRSSAKGRFAYVNISDPFGIFEAMIFDEEIITNARDLLEDGSVIVIECLIKKDEGGIRILVREVIKLEDFIKNVKAQAEPFEDIKKQKKRVQREGDDGSKRDWNKPQNKDGAKNNFSQQKNHQANKAGGETGWSKNKNDGWQKNYAKSDQASDAFKQRIERLEAKQIYDEVKIYINERDPIFSIKATLSQMVAPLSFAKKTRVILVVEIAEKIANIILQEQYLLDEADVNKLRLITKVKKVEVC